MVDSEIPFNYTASPSSLSGTPLLTINRDANLDPESSNAFEGPEKLLEVWFAPSANDVPANARSNGLKDVPASDWTEMLDLVHCKVLSVVESEHVDAYLLSESSMFVFPHKLVLKTCGITTLLSGLPKILEIAAISAGFPHTPANPAKGQLAVAQTHRVFYSRKNFLFPDQQRGPHRSWRDEVRALDKIFRGGSAYMIGKMNGDHWYLYITEPTNPLTPPITPIHEKLPQLMPTKTQQLLSLPEPMAKSAMNHIVQPDDTEDETLEILMTDLDPENAKQFYLDHASAVAEGQFFQEAHQKNKKEMGEALGVLGDDDDPTYHDVFEQTSTENAAMSTSPFTSSSSSTDSTIANNNLPIELTTEGHALGKLVSDSSGLSNVYPISKYPDARIDAYLFTPCGFSANGVIPAPTNTTSPTSPTTPSSQRLSSSTKSTHYFNVHVTPEPQCSYASFETNVPARQSGRETASVIEQVVAIFRPGRFSVTLFEAKSPSSCINSPSTGPPQSPVVPLERRDSYPMTKNMDAIPGYRRIDRIVHDLDGYDLVFRYFERLDWKGDGVVRLGESF